MDCKCIKHKILFAVITFIIMICIFVFFGGTGADAAETIESGDYICTVLEDEKSVEITRYKGQSLYVSLPSKIDNYTVTSVGSSAFMSNETIKELEISSTISLIDSNAFSDCTALIKLQIPGNVTTIGASAFSGCTSLVDVTILDGVKLIDKYAFARCTQLKNLVLPNSIDSIGDYAFFGCSVLSDIQIPRALKNFGGYVLEGTQWMENQQQDCVIVGDGILIKYSGSAKSKALPEQVKTIGSYAFAGNNQITTILIPKTVTEIEQSAFENCTRLEYVDIPSSVLSIGKRAFFGCKSLNDITLPASVPKIDESTFEGCSSLSMIIIPVNTVTICVDAFKDCIWLQSVKFQDGLQEIQPGAFKNCKSIGRLVFPKTLKIINSYSFENCDSLTRIEFNSDVNIQNSAFADCLNLIDAAFYKNMTAVEAGIFNACPDVVLYSDNDYYLETYAAENKYKCDNIKNMKDYENKGIMTVDSKDKSKEFSLGYTFIVIAIIIVDVGAVILASAYLLFISPKRKRKKQVRSANSAVKNNTKN